MIRSAIRTLVRKRLNEATADQWSDADVNAGIDTGYQLVENVVLEADPTAFIKVDTAALVADQHEYATPASLIGEIEVAILDSTTGKYDVIEKGNYRDVRNKTGTQQYCHYGRYFYLGPAPTANLAAGLQVTYVPALVLGVDASVPQIAQNYHMAIVLSASIVLIGETADGAEKMIAEREYLFGALRLSYRGHTAGPDHIQVSQMGSMKKRY